jgi:mannose/fructose/N-acetylgalactosamine-specific phosphotransferase system component IIC
MKKILAISLAIFVYAIPMTSKAGAMIGDENYNYYLAAGAIGGALAFNFITGGVEALPFMTSSSSLWEGPLAANRVLTALSVALGVMAVDWSYHNLDLKNKKIEAPKPQQ